MRHLCVCVSQHLSFFFFSLCLCGRCICCCRFFLLLALFVCVLFLCEAVPTTHLQRGRRLCVQGGGAMTTRSKHTADAPLDTVLFTTQSSQVAPLDDAMVFSLSAKTISRSLQFEECRLYKKCSWPSGPRRQIKALVSQEAWVQTPPNTNFYEETVIVFFVVTSLKGVNVPLMFKQNMTQAHFIRSIVWMTLC